MARKKKRSSSKLYLKIFFWLCLILVSLYYTVSLFIIQPHVFYPGFQIEIPNGYEIHGIDVSRYQSTINWKEVKNMEEKGIKIGFVFMKATEGVNNVDEQFRRNWLKAQEQNIPKGAYHFFIPGKDARRQADNFIEIVNLKKGDMPPVLDIERGHRFSVPEMQKEVKTWLDEVEKNYGVKPIIYTNIGFYQKYFQQGFEDYPLWIAHYLQPDKPRIENKWVIWQHSESGRVDGIKAPVDFNVFYGDSADFNNFLIR
ncbi:MAG: glycoside hydrolase family 25 protein [Bacteroidota bacterium]|nr:glycoside hydrolase family 25 protein [Bacteroidota bacterium]